MNGPQQKVEMERRVRSGVPIGILAYLKGEPVAWCSIAPRPTYRSLGGPDTPGEAPGSVCSIAFLFVTRDLRGQGLRTQVDRVCGGACACTGRHGRRSLSGGGRLA